MMGEQHRTALALQLEDLFSQTARKNHEPRRLYSILTVLFQLDAAEEDNESRKGGTLLLVAARRAAPNSASHGVFGGNDVQVRRKRLGHTYKKIRRTAARPKALASSSRSHPADAVTIRTQSGAPGDLHPLSARDLAALARLRLFINVAVGNTDGVALALEI
jgi:hypothetical protein